MLSNNLAIVIPAYKATYLEEALASIAKQTCKDFTLYIGDDCSPYDLKSIITKFEGKIDLVYQRFDTNMGGKDLVSQWERCIDMNQGEEWIWLFSDDDVMNSNCVEEFYKKIKSEPKAKLVHFDVNQIVNNSDLIQTLPAYNQFMTTKEYLDSKLKGRIVSFVVEFIVHRDVFYVCHRFQNFDQAWGSDFISWVKFAHQAGGIYTCHSAKVNWRSSGENISTDESNASVFRKMKAVMEYSHWILSFARQQGYGHSFFYSKYSLGELMRRRKQLSWQQNFTILKQFMQLNGSYLFSILIDMLRYPFYKSKI